MSDIPPIQSAGQMAGFTPQRAVASRLPVTDDFNEDHLEISETGQLLSELEGNCEIRAEKVAEIRRAIADGTYETQDKLDITVDRLLDVLRVMSVTA